jgi:putative ABC transport system substrate-binding protein
MRRREFIMIFGAATAAWPLAARTQPMKVPRVGWIWAGRSAGNPAEVAGFRQGLEEFGYLEGQNVVVDYRFGEGRNDRLGDLAVDLIQLRPDVVVAIGGLAARAIRNVNAVVPIVMMHGDPVGMGVIASLARPGGNVTGVSMMQGAEGLTGKRIELLKDALPTATRIGLMFDPDGLTSAGDLAQAEQVASRLGVVIRAFPVRPGDKIEEAIAALAREGIDGLHVQAGQPFISYPRETGELLLKYRVPAISELRQIAESGGLLSYGPNLFDATRRLAYFVDRILKGAKPTDLPVEQPTKFQLVINLKTAKAMGLAIPPLVLARADEVIE